MQAQHLASEPTTTVDVEVRYQMPVVKKEAETGFTLPTQFGLVNRLTLTGSTLATLRHRTAG